MCCERPENDNQIRKTLERVSYIPFLLISQRIYEFNNQPVQQLWQENSERRNAKEKSSIAKDEQKEISFFRLFDAHQ